MATELVPYASPNAGVWTAPGDFLTALLAVDQVAVSSTAASGQFFVSLGDAPTGVTDPVASLTVRVLARLSEAGTRQIAAGMQSGGTTLYHPDTIVATSTEWAEYAWTWTANPWTVAPWTVADVNTVARCYVRCATTAGTTNVEVDQLQVLVEYATVEPTEATRTINDGVPVTDTATASGTTQEVTIQLHDGVGVTDTDAPQGVDAATELDDGVGVTDDAAPSSETMDVTVTLWDGVGATDSLVLAQDLTLTLHDGVGATDDATATSEGPPPAPPVAVEAIHYGGADIVRVYVGDALIWAVE